MNTYRGSVAEPREGGRVVHLHRIERDGESWLLLVAPDGCLRIPEGLAGHLATLLRSHAKSKRIGQ